MGRIDSGKGFNCSKGIVEIEFFLQRIFHFRQVVAFLLLEFETICKTDILLIKEGLIQLNPDRGCSAAKRHNSLIDPQVSLNICDFQLELENDLR
ncbi:hypothetical protein NPIL_624981 [Nephila pilipes]|uniref:Uncharacterized protein n=1 Tax=Nephila pilipes TaxID=299642 RepID=A0A8X6N962_NEPPI|nr:hypothetical protein NPIL_624981 [Nephila pilipes]